MRCAFGSLVQRILFCVFAPVALDCHYSYPFYFHVMSAFAAPPAGSHEVQYLVLNGTSNTVVNEVQSITCDATGGFWAASLGPYTTGPIAWNARCVCVCVNSCACVHV